MKRPKSLNILLNICFLLLYCIYILLILEVKWLTRLWRTRSQGIKCKGLKRWWEVQKMVSAIKEFISWKYKNYLWIMKLQSSHINECPVRFNASSNNRLSILLNFLMTTTTYTLDQHNQSQHLWNYCANAKFMGSIPEYSNYHHHVHNHLLSHTPLSIMHIITQRSER